MSQKCPFEWVIETRSTQSYDIDYHNTAILCGTLTTTQTAPFWFFVLCGRIAISSTFVRDWYVIAVSPRSALHAQQGVFDKLRRGSALKHPSNLDTHSWRFKGPCKRSALLRGTYYSSPCPVTPPSVPPTMNLSWLRGAIMINKRGQKIIHIDPASWLIIVYP